jgi:hypothetical protein
MAKSVDAAEIAQRGLQLPSYDDAAVAAGLTQLRQLMAERDSQGWSDAEAEWFLKDRSLEVEEAADKLARYAAWRANGFTSLSLDDTAIAAEAATGKAYLRDDTDVVRFTPTGSVHPLSHPAKAAPIGYPLGRPCSLGSPRCSPLQHGWRGAPTRRRSLGRSRQTGPDIATLVI